MGKGKRHGIIMYPMADKLRSKINATFQVKLSSIGDLPPSFNLLNRC